jgi:hypothetical protein
MATADVRRPGRRRGLFDERSQSPGAFDRTPSNNKNTVSASAGDFGGSGSGSGGLASPAAIA